MDDPCSLLAAHFLPSHHTMINLLSRLQVVEWATIMQADQVPPVERIQDLIVLALRSDTVNGLRAEDQDMAVGLNAQILQLRVDRGGDVGQQGPGSRCPNQ